MTTKIASKQKQVYVLDYNTWRSGEESVHKVGIGDTKMLNEEGYACCLGQFAQQKGIRRHFLMDIVEPGCVADRIKKVYDKNFCKFTKSQSSGVFNNTSLSDKLIHVNDSNELSQAQKLFAIRKHLHEAGCRLVIKNLPYEVSIELVSLYKKKGGVNHENRSTGY